MPRAQFTKIEIDRILALHRDGLSNKFIAERLGLRADPAGVSRICRAIKRAAGSPVAPTKRRRHAWEDFVPKNHCEAMLGPRQRVCLNCGVKQSEEKEYAWMRVVSRRWEPLVGCCKGPPR